MDENGPFLDDLPINIVNNGDLKNRYVKLPESISKFPSNGGHN